MTASLIVYAIDITSSGVSTARLTEGGTPRCGYAPSTRAGSFAAIDQLSAFDEFAEKVVTGILAGGRPNLVVLNKLTVDHQRSDSSGPTRAGLWWTVARHLTDAAMPVAEAPPLLAAAKLFTNAVGGIKPSQVHERAAIQVPTLWPGIKLPAAEKFRAIAPVYAACGLMALGGTTPIRMTDSRSRVLSMMKLPPTDTEETNEAENKEAS